MQCFRQTGIYESDGRRYGAHVTLKALAGMIERQGNVVGFDVRFFSRHLQEESYDWRQERVV